MKTYLELFDEVERLQRKNVELSRESEERRRSLLAETDRAEFWHTAASDERKEVERLRDQLKHMTLYRDNALALYRSANVRAWIAGDHSTHPEELK